jgi:hypothetical protein
MPCPFAFAAAAQSGAAAGAAGKRASACPFSGKAAVADDEGEADQVGGGRAHAQVRAPLRKR